MIRNFFITAWRNLLKGKLHSIINVTGLSLGMAVAITISLWIYGELSFDKNFANYNRIGQVIQNLTVNGQTDTWWRVPYPLASEIREHYGASFKHVVMSVETGEHKMTHGEKKLTQSGGFFDHGIEEMLSLEIIHGAALDHNDPASVLLSESVARAFFGKENAINKMIQIDDRPLVKVRGVYKDLPKNSSFNDLQFISTVNFHYNSSPWVKQMDDPWRPNNFRILVMLNDNTSFETASAKIKDAKLRKVNTQLAKMKPELFIMPMNTWHLFSEFKNGVNTGGAIEYVWMFGIIGAFVLVLACVNFVNLSTARSEKRAKEVGIRKTLGSQRFQLIIQFFCESLLTVSCAFAVSLLLVQLGLPFFNEVAKNEISIPWGAQMFWMMCTSFILFTALVSGLYPAIFLSSFIPVKVLKGTFTTQRFATLPRKVLVVLQFTVSVSLIICTFIVYRQIEFAKDRPVGYNRNRLVRIPSSEDLHKHFDVMKQELTQAGVITSMAESGSPTTSIWNASSRFSWPGKNPDVAVNFGNVPVSYDYGKTIGWTVIRGRDFSRDYGADTSALIVNEAALKHLDMKEPVGQPMTWRDRPYTIIGVVADMVMESPYEAARPIIYNLVDDGSVLLLKLKPSVASSKAIAAIGAAFKKIEPDEDFEYSFVEEEYATKFGEEERISKLSGFFAILAIVISCLGLVGLTSFVAERRRKEIGVRKVLGASIFSIWNLLSKDFVVLVVISILVSVPVSYYFISGWLENYYYRSDVSWWIFAAAGLLALAIAILVVSVQVVRAALANPVRSLRME